MAQRIILDRGGLEQNFLGLLRVNLFISRKAIARFSFGLWGAKHNIIVLHKHLIDLLHLSTEALKGAGRGVPLDNDNVTLVPSSPRDPLQFSTLRVFELNPQFILRR